MASRRRYTTSTEISEYADIIIDDSGEADDQISQAEEMIDAYIGFQNKHIKTKHEGMATGGTTTTLIDTSALGYNDNYFNYCEIEIVAGTNVGEIRQITSSDRSANSITVNEAFTAAIDNTSVYIIRQLGRFPRVKDVFTKTVDSESIYYKSIPEAIKRAVAAQLQYIIEKGVEFFAGATDKKMEIIGDYHYQVKDDAERLIAPKARMLLKGIFNRKGRLI